MSDFQWKTYRSILKRRGFPDNPRSLSVNNTFMLTLDLSLISLFLIKIKKYWI